MEEVFDGHLVYFADFIGRRGFDRDRGPTGSSFDELGMDSRAGCYHML